jgi:hypothetical protein
MPIGVQEGLGLAAVFTGVVYLTIGVWWGLRVLTGRGVGNVRQAWRILLAIPVCLAVLLVLRESLPKPVQPFFDPAALLLVARLGLQARARVSVADSLEDETDAND